MLLPGYQLTPLLVDSGYAVYRAIREQDGLRAVVITTDTPEPTAVQIARLENTYRLRSLLGPTWAVVPIEMHWVAGQPAQVLVDPGGVSLASHCGAALGTESFLRIALATVIALRQCHAAGITHRDFKPSSILVSADAERAWIGGFGLATTRLHDDSPIALTGTIAYMAPVQSGRMNRGVDTRSDLYALGVSLFELFAGRRPFASTSSKVLLHDHVARPAPPLEEHAAWVPAPLAAIVAKLLEKAPEDRYQSASCVEADLRSCLAQWQASGTIAPFSLSGAPPPPRPVALVRETTAPVSTTATIVSGVEHLDLDALLEVSNALSGEESLDALVATLLATVLEQAGGQRALLVNPELTTIRGSVRLTENGVTTDTVLRPLGGDTAALSVLRRAVDSRQSAVVDDVSVLHGLSDDPYWRATKRGSVLGIPLVHRGRIDGVLYVENELAPYAFGARRIAFLRMLAAHAASALAAATLFADLHGSEARYRRLFDNVPLALVQLDTRGYKDMFDELRAAGVDLVEYVRTAPDFVDRIGPLILGRVANIAAARLLGIATVDEVHRPLGFLWHAAPDTLRRSVMARLRGAKGHSEQTKLGTIDGRVIDVLFTIAFREDGDDGAPLDIVSLVDLTELVSAQRALTALQAEFAHAARVSVLGELTASLAHEISQPLLGIRANAAAASRWIDRPAPNLEEALAATRRIGSDATRSATILDRIRIMAANKLPQRVPSKLNALVEEATQFLQHELRARGVALHLELGSDLPDVNVDRVQIQQVIVNLAVNSIQAIARAECPTRTVRIRTATDTDGVHVTVADSGPGFSSEDAPRLFESFFSTREDGMGMGLRISRSLVEAHEGTIEARNRPEGGAEFVFHLPAGIPS